MRYIKIGAAHVAAENNNLNVHTSISRTNQIGIGNHNNAPNNVGNPDANISS